MNFVALIGLIIHIEKTKIDKYIDLRISSSNGEEYIAKVTIKNKEIFNDIELGNIVGINGIVDFSNDNKIILKNYVII